jgi:hypothetical protein
VENLADAERDAISFRRRVQLEQEAQDLADERYRAQEDQLRLQYDLAQTEADRRRIALQILDADDAYLRSRLEAVVASETATKAEQERARIALEAVNATASGRRAATERQHQGALGRYLNSTTDPRAAAEEAAVRELEAVRDGLAEGLAEQFGVKNDLVKSLLSIFLDDVLFRPIAQALSQGGGGGIGGILGSVVGGLFGGFRANGGPVSPGKAYMVGERGPEMIVPRAGGMVIPNERLASRASTTVINQSFVLDARHGITTPQLLQYVNQTAQAAAVQTGAQVGKAVMKSVPKRMADFQRDGT